jgi:excisionase family DNA binding protein
VAGEVGVRPSERGDGLTRGQEFSVLGPGSPDAFTVVSHAAASDRWKSGGLRTRAFAARSTRLRVLSDSPTINGNRDGLAHMDTYDPKLHPFDVKGAAPRIGCSPRTVRRLALSGAISHYRVGRRGLIRFRPEDIDEYLKRHRVAVEI